MKTCNSCRNFLPYQAFGVYKKSADGLRTICKKCRKNSYYHKKYGCGKEELKKLKTNCNSKLCKICNLTKEKKHFVKRTGYGDGFRNICLSCHYIREHIRDKHRRYTNINYRLSKSVSNKVWKSLKGAKDHKHWEYLVGYSISDLKTHLESLFAPGMTWENYGLWHIDHIKPVSSFSINSHTSNEFKECWSLKNLQPLWAEDNRRKYNKIIQNRAD